MAAVFREVYCAVPSANPASQEIAMVNVIASISIKAGRISEYLAILKDSMQAVRKEKECIEYIATVDVDIEANLPPQALDKNVVTIIEKWESLEALKAHLRSPHMLNYREKTKNMVERVSLKVLQEAA